EELRNFWKPISPFPFMSRLQRMGERPMRFIVARYDLTFPIDLSREAIEEARRLDLPLDVVWLPCGHYTTGELPWKAIDAWIVAHTKYDPLNTRNTRNRPRGGTDFIQAKSTKQQAYFANGNTGSIS